MTSPRAQHILICLIDFYPGGVERIAIGLAKKWVEAGREVTILCGAASGGLENTVHPSVKLIELDPPVQPSAFSRLRLGKLMASHFEALRPDVVFLPGNFHLFLANGMRRSAFCPPIGLKISNPPLPGGLTSIFATPVFRHFGAGITAFSALSEGLARETRAAIPGKPVTVVADPVFLGAHQNQEKFEPPGGRQNVIWAGRLEPQKDILLAIRTMAALPENANIHLTICGDGALRQKAEALSIQLRLQSRISFAGHVPSLDPYLAKASALLMTSHYEGAPAVVGEALALGVPVVSTDCAHFLHDVMTIAEAGKIVKSRNPSDIATALIDTVSRPKAARIMLPGLVAHLEPTAAATAYLEWLDQIVAAQAKG